MLKILRELFYANGENVNYNYEGLQQLYLKAIKHRQHVVLALIVKYSNVSAEN